MKPRLSMVRTKLAEKRLEHPELRASITFEKFMTVIEREKMIFIERKISSEGVAMNVMGTACIGLNPSLKGNEARRLLVLAHELGHVLLGHIFDHEMTEKRVAQLNHRYVERGGKTLLVTDRSPIEDALEAEADLFADLLLERDIELAEAA